MRFHLFGCATVLALAATTALAAPCTPAPTRLCLADGRFAVDVSWRDFQNNSGAGRAVPITADTGYFWFFAETNVELVVKVLDARVINGHFWVFFGALSNVEYTLKVTDSVSGASKTYVNPSGQFASVGDTAAFRATGAGSVPAEALVVAEGQRSPPSTVADVGRFVAASVPRSAEAVAPCEAAPTDLVLGDCRFRIRVTWKDFQGRTGEGTAVQLTSDTGYFWFFGPNNVEVVIKVLDARALNGHHWVFYGALSNVEYTITVIDRMTGATRRYTNPSGRFASVGDTGAIKAGHSVNPAKDSGRSASAAMDGRGGELTATAADGTQFHLQIPRGALLFPTEIRMTPLSSVGRLPFSGGLVGGVALEPEDLALLAPAILTIRPARVRPQERLMAFSYAGGGEDFVLALRHGSPAQIQIPLFHFSGYGVGEGSAAEADSISEPSNALTAYFQLGARYAHQFLSREITLEQYRAYIHALLTDLKLRILRPLVDRATTTCALADTHEAALVALSVIRFIDTFSSDPSDLTPELQQLRAGYMDMVKEMLHKCFEYAYQRCKSEHAPEESITMLAIARQLEFLGVEVPEASVTPGSKLEKCLRFELDFDSKLHHDDGDEGAVIDVSVRATIPLRIFIEEFDLALRWSGEAPINYYAANYAITGCKSTYETTGDTFSVTNARLVGLKFLDVSDTDVTVFYRPGDPMVKFTYHCPDEQPFPGAWTGTFTGIYSIFHNDELTEAGYRERDWLFIGRNRYAERRYERTRSLPGGVASVAEKTTMIIRHTPE
jgi:hypothetical protein